MATIVNTPGDGGDNGAGWVVAIVVIIILILLALFLFPRMFSDRTDSDVLPTPEPSPVINNTIINSTTTVDRATTTDEE